MFLGLSHRAVEGMDLVPRMDVVNTAGLPTSRLQHAAIFLVFFFPAVALVAASLRFHRKAKVGFGWDDGFVTFALTTLLANVALTFLVIRIHGFGLDSVDAPEQSKTEYARLIRYLSGLFDNLSLSLVKSSVIIYFLTPSLSKSLSWCLHIANIFNLITLLGSLVAYIFQCSPVPSFWDKARPGYCVNDTILGVSLVGVSLLTDAVVFATSVFFTRRKQLPALAKGLVSIVFAIGLGVVALDALRFHSAFSMFSGYPPQNYGGNISFTYPTISASLGITAASLPTLRPLFQRWLPPPATPKISRPLQHGYRLSQRRARDAGASVLSFAFKGALGRSYSVVHARGKSDSEEHIVGHSGIMQVREVHVNYDRNSRFGRPKTRDGPLAEEVKEGGQKRLSPWFF